MSENELETLERVERAAWSDLFAAAPAPTRETLALSSQDIDGGLALSARAPSTLLNRIIAGPRDAAGLARVTRHYRERGVRRYFVQIDRAARSPALEAALRGVGLRRYRAWVKLLRGPGPVPDLESDLAVREARPADAGTLGGIWARAFDLPEVCAPMIGGLIGRPGWQVLIAADGARPVALGILYREGAVAYLAGGATDPEYRRRGAQGALVALRVRAALSAGCRLVGTETGEAVDGEPQHSQRNLERCGFRPVGAVDNYVPAG